MEPDIRKDVRLLLFWGIRSHDSGECPNKGCFGKLLTHFVKLCFTSFNFNSAFLGGLRRVQFIASLMRRKFRKKLAPLLFFMSEHKSFCAKRKKLLGSIIGASQLPVGRVLRGLA